MPARFLPLFVVISFMLGCSSEEAASTAAPAAETHSHADKEAHSHADKASAAPAATEEQQAEPAATAEAEGKEAPAAAAPTATALFPDAEGVVRVEATDMMRFNTERIEVEGTKVKLELKHVGKIAKEAMGHNLVVLKPGTDSAAWSAKAASHKDNGYIPAGDAEMLAHTKLLGGGESDLIEFELPGPGEYPFLCSFPGHSTLMKGVLVVK